MVRLELMAVRLVLLHELISPWYHRVMEYPVIIQNLFPRFDVPRCPTGLIADIVCPRTAAVWLLRVVGVLSAVEQFDELLLNDMWVSPP